MSYRMTGLETVGIVVISLFGTLLLVKIGMKCWKKYKYRNLPRLSTHYEKNVKILFMNYIYIKIY